MTEFIGNCGKKLEHPYCSPGLEDDFCAYCEFNTRNQYDELDLEEVD